MFTCSVFKVVLRQSFPHSQSPLQVPTDYPVSHITRKHRAYWIAMTLLIAAFMMPVWAAAISLTEKASQDIVKALAWSPDEKQLLSASSDGALQIWDIATGKTVARVKSGFIGVNAVAWSQDGTLVAVASDKKINFYQIPGLRIIASMPTGSEHVMAMCFDPNSFDLYSLTHDFTVSVWDYQHQKRLGGLPGSEDFFIDVAGFSSDSERIVTLESKQDGQVLSVYERINMEMLMTLTFTDAPKDTNLVDLNATGTNVLAVNSSTLSAWGVNNSELLGSIDLEYFPPTAFALGTRNNRMAVGGSNNRIRLYDKQGKYLRELQQGSTQNLLMAPLSD